MQMTLPDGATRQMMIYLFKNKFRMATRLLRREFMIFRLLLLLALVTGTLLLAGCLTKDEIKLGGIATLEGNLAILGQDAMRGIDLALQEHGYQAGGKRISAVAASSDASPESVIDAARNLVEKQKVNIVIGPLASNEGLAIREYAKTQPGTTFVNGSSAAQELTLQNTAANFFLFTPDAVQWQAGLGQYAYKRKSYQSVLTMA
jgi:branched-chain amino acid transport system substrate-binding protein